jgi:hypothetical protein
MIELIRPQILKNNKMTLILAVNSVYEYTDPILNVTINKTLRTITLGEFGYPGKNTNWDMDKPSAEKLQVYSAMQSLSKSCVDNAEDIKSRLLEILTHSRHRKNNVEKEELMRTPFKKLKNLFMNDVLTTKIYKEFTTLNSTAKLKPFWKIFDDFIEDRNKYTHGHLCVIRPSFDYAIEFIDNDNKSKYANISKEVFVSYCACYMAIREVITQYNIIHQNRILGKAKTS